MKKVSIILPVYNVEKYIGDCITSIINQSCTDFELIIVDDESKDQSISIAKELLSNSQIDYKIINRKNGGLSAARNTGMNVAEGEFLCFVDSDDVIHPDYLKTLLLDAENNNVELAIGNFKSVNENNKFDFDKTPKKGKIVDKKHFLKKILKRKIFNYFGCFLIKRQFFLDNNICFDEKVFFGVDQACMWKLMVLVPVYTYNFTIVYNYLDRPGSIMTSTRIDRMLTGLPSLVKCSEEIASNKYFDSRLIVIRWKISALHTIAKAFDFKDFCEALNKFDPSINECLKYPDIRVRLTGLSLLFSKKLMYTILRKH